MISEYRDFRAGIAPLSAKIAAVEAAQSAIPETYVTKKELEKRKDGADLVEKELRAEIVKTNAQLQVQYGLAVSWFLVPFGILINSTIWLQMLLNRIATLEQQQQQEEEVVVFEASVEQEGNPQQP